MLVVRVASRNGTLIVMVVVLVVVLVIIEAGFSSRSRAAPLGRRSGSKRQGRSMERSGIYVMLSAAMLSDAQDPRETVGRGFFVYKVTYNVLRCCGHSWDTRYGETPFRLTRLVENSVIAPLLTL